MLVCVVRPVTLEAQKCTHWFCRTPYVYHLLLMAGNKNGLLLPHNTTDQGNFIGWINFSSASSTGCALFGYFVESMHDMVRLYQAKKEKKKKVSLVYVSSLQFAFSYSLCICTSSDFLYFVSNFVILLQFPSMLI